MLGSDIKSELLPEDNLDMLGSDIKSELLPRYNLDKLSSAIKTELLPGKHILGGFSALHNNGDIDVEEGNKDETQRYRAKHVGLEEIQKISAVLGMPKVMLV
ncbi:hypothetical protein RRG08_042688 [Elysia crispata]|uniref:Uncharacterized protein n=1 Tax=Elysia crispata TaxID=231223 RepID=A0AAE0XQL8_9GAST|nr:hypothetical protein RRG08_042688 [Elysia crispata]